MTTALLVWFNTLTTFGLSSSRFGIRHVADVLQTFAVQFYKHDSKPGLSFSEHTFTVQQFRKHVRIWVSSSIVSSMWNWTRPRGAGACLANILISNAKIVPPQKWPIIRHGYMNSTFLTWFNYSPIKCKAEGTPSDIFVWAQVPERLVIQVLNNVLLEKQLTSYAKWRTRQHLLLFIITKKPLQPVSFELWTDGIPIIP